MKKLLLLPFFALFAIACTTDSEDLENYNASNYKEMQTTVASAVITPSNTFSCFNNLGAHHYINTANGLNNATITFISETPADASSGGYKVKVEIEQLADCEDLNSGSGNIKTFTTGATYTNVGANPPQISGIRPSDTFACYRWRMVFEGVNRTIAAGCVSVTPWYDAPLF